jgi:hypothetical protein
LLRAHKINKTVGICLILSAKGWQSGSDFDRKRGSKGKVSGYKSKNSSFAAKLI